jgi:hypothetical protein
MKVFRCLLLLPLAGLTASCASTPDVVPALTYAEKETAVLKQVAPQVAGRWTLTDVQYVRRPFFQYPASLPRDTVFAQLATLTITPALTPRASREGRPEFEGQLTYGSKTYPVRFSLYASAERVVRQQGPPAHFLLEYNFPVGSHQTEPEEQFLQDIGLIGEQFSLEAEAGQPTMQWKGLDQHLKSITLRK